MKSRFIRDQVIPSIIGTVIGIEVGKALYYTHTKTKQYFFKPKEEPKHDVAAKPTDTSLRPR